jgi:SAM-dependent methyltransferase
MSLSRLAQSWIKGLAYRCGYSLRRLRAAKATVATGGDFTGRVRPLLHKVDPYQDFKWHTFPDNCSGWGSDSAAFGELVTEIKPARVIEVGTWKGGSALTLAGELEKQGLDTEIICVDTWLGALEMWTDQGDEERFGSLGLKHGYPSLYYQFLANVCRAGQQSRITPFPIPSATAAQWFALHDVRADLIYIDGSHEEEDVYQDLVSYWDLVRPGGVLFGDDWSWDGVRLAVERFAKENGLPITHRHDKWELKRRA